MRGVPVVECRTRGGCNWGWARAVVMVRGRATDARCKKDREPLDSSDPSRGKRRSPVSCCSSTGRLTKGRPQSLGKSVSFHEPRPPPLNQRSRLRWYHDGQKVYFHSNRKNSGCGPSHAGISWPAFEVSDTVVKIDTGNFVCVLQCPTVHPQSLPAETYESGLG
jgi:hypothetical protein